MRLAIARGVRIGVYEITAPLGEGGMGQVWRATDTTLGRQVAIKILPDAFASDPERLARFEREAKTLASLNHPHIAAIYGFEKSSGGHALVMELVEGEDLSQRIARGAIPMDEALPIARQIAEALEAAHEQGIIHRDLKPANVKVRDDGTVKVLDFGLAKAFDTNAPSAAVNDSPTVTSPAMTERGMILGTAAYMAPEQAKGKTVDRRADVWALGVVLYEMLAGRRAFKGEDTTDTILAVVSKEPDWQALPRKTPAPIHKLLRRCLEKDRKRRLDSVADARLEIEDALAAPASADGFASAATGSGFPARSSLPAWIIAGAMLIAAAVMLALWAPWHDVPVLAETRVDIVTPDTDNPTSFAISPDGLNVAFVALSDGVSRLWLRSLATTTAKPLSGTEGAAAPFWSPDSRSLGFAAANALKRVDIAGGEPQTLAPAANFRGGAWFKNGVILYAPSAIGPLMRVSATGGKSEVMAIPDRHQNHRWPHAIPNGQQFLFFVVGPPDTAGIYLGALDGRAPTRLTSSRSGGVYLSDGPGWLLWIRSSALMAQPLDLVNAKLTADPVTVADNVLVEGTFNQGALSVSTEGLVGYRTGTATPRQLTWFDRTGTAQGTLGEPDRDAMRSPSLSPDGKRAVVSRTVQGNEDVWLLDGPRMTRFTFNEATESFPLWSPDGRKIVFRSNRKGPGDLYEKLTSGATEEEAITSSNETKTAISWSSDGRFLLQFVVGAGFNYDLWVTPMFGAARTPSKFLATPYREMWSAFSPDGRWVAYMSDESGRNEIYVRPFAVGSAGTPAAVEGQWQVSTAGGGFPVWRRDGKELYYLSVAGELMAAAIGVTGATLAPGAPVRLFQTRIAGSGVEVGLGRQYDVAADGRFLINTELGGTPEPIRLLSNWHPETKQ